MTGPSPVVSVVVVADGPWEETLRCLTALARAAAGLEVEVIVVDDGTGDETATALPRLPGVVSLRGDQPQGFAAAANAGASVARAPLLAFLHADAEPHPSWLEPLLRAAADPALVAVGSRLVDPAGLLEDTDDPAVPAPGLAGPEGCSAAALLVRTGPFLAAAGFRPVGAPRALAEDLLARLAGGGRAAVSKESGVRHAGRCQPAAAAAAVPARRGSSAEPAPGAAPSAAAPSPAARQVLSFVVEALAGARPASVLEVGVRQGGAGLLLREALAEAAPGAGPLRLEGTLDRELPPGSPAALVYDRLHVGPLESLLAGLADFDAVVALDALDGLEVAAGQARLRALLCHARRQLVVAVRWSAAPAPPGGPRRAWRSSDLEPFQPRLRLFRLDEGQGVLVCVIAPEGQPTAPVSDEAAAALAAVDATWAGEPPPRRPLHVTYLVPHHNLTGGLKVLLEQVRRLGARGHRVRAVFRGQAPRALPAWSDATAAEELVLEPGAPLAGAFAGTDVVVCGVFPAVPECAAAGRPVLYLEQGHEFLFEVPQGSGDHLDVVFRQFDRALTCPTPVATVSPFVAGLLRRTFGRHAEVIPNGVDTERFHPAPHDAAGRRVLLVGNPGLAFKGFDAALQALSLVARQVPGLVVTWVSQRPAEVAGLPFAVDNVVDPPQRDLPALYRAQDVHLFTSRYEAFALPPLEAMASGVAVVTTDCGGVRAYARAGENCLLAAPDDVGALAQGVASLLLDPARRARLAARGRETAEGFSIERSIDALEIALLRVAARGGA